MESVASRLAAAQRFGAILFCVGFLVVGVTLFLAPSHAFPSYLMGFLFWMGLTLGCFPVLMIYHLVGGIWAVPIRKFLEAGISTLPVMAVLLVPLLFGFGYLYRWIHPVDLRTAEVLERKEIYLNMPAWLIRTALFFCVWGAQAFLLLRWSRRQLESSDPRPTLALRKISAPGLIVFGLTTSFAVVDWVMSLEPDWYSSIFPLIIIMGQILSALALSIVLARTLLFGADEATPDQLNQLGDLLLTFVMLWAYMTISQIIIIYAGNLPNEITWYLHRMRGGWLSLSWVVALFAFGVPFFLLLFRHLKRAPTWLSGIAGGLLVMHAVCVFWYVAPSFRSSISFDWLDPFAFIGVGGAWVLVFSRQLSHNLRLSTISGQSA
ncbi:MAG: hypothetical protein JO271_00230 [Verrucomicrobia bacterium]|nr:hypothetical protein [Verrucomicrobiota bacterium]MBV9273190.1 hypothetical protein [Verrucomicrobiota bacterium]